MRRSIISSLVTAMPNGVEIVNDGRGNQHLALRRLGFVANAKEIKMRRERSMKVDDIE